MADTAIVILLGQSLNSWRGSTRELTTGDASARMLVGGGSVHEMDFFGTNNDDMFDWNDAASLVTQAETIAGQSPIAGIATTLADAGYTRIYLGSVSVGSRGITDLRGRGAICNLYGMMQRFVTLAAAAGDTAPEIFFYSAHGEADAASALDANYEADALDYYQRCQLAAAQCLGDPTYVAPIILSLPIQNKNPTAGSDASDDIAIKTAIRNIADSSDIDNTILYGSVYHWPVDASAWVHPTEAAYVLRGEAIGKVITDYIGGTTYAPLRLTSVTQSGTTVTCQFTHNIVKDTTEIGDVGSNLSGTDGFEYFDNGTPIAINSVVVSGDTATLTLASTPSGTDAQQTVRVGCQPTAASAGTWPANGAGAPIRKDMTAWTSTFDVTYDNYDWALQEEAVGLPYSYTPGTAFPGTVAGDGGHIWPARSNDPRWAQIITDSGITSSGNFIDDVHAALEALTSTTGAVDDLWKKFKEANAKTDVSEPFTY